MEIAEIKILPVVLKDGTTRDCTVEIYSERKPRLVFYGPVSDVREVEADDLFEALRRLRTLLEQDGFRLLCNGSRIDVSPSGMSRGMSGGRKAYVLRLGVPGELADLVDIFEYAEPSATGTVAQQSEFKGAWIASLRGTEPEVKPFAGEIEEAKRYPNGWVYRIAGNFAPDSAVPAEAIVGAWQVDSQGRIAGDFIK